MYASKYRYFMIWWWNIAIAVVSVASPRRMQPSSRENDVWRWIRRWIKKRALVARTAIA